METHRKSQASSYGGEKELLGKMAFDGLEKQIKINNIKITIILLGLRKSRWAACRSGGQAAGG